MKNIKICLLCAVLCFSGCKSVKKLVGWGKEEEPKQTEQSTKVIVPSTHKVPVTSNTVINLALYCTITLAVLFAIRYGIKKFRRKDE